MKLVSIFTTFVTKFQSTPHLCRAPGEAPQLTRYGKARSRVKLSMKIERMCTNFHSTTQVQLLPLYTLAALKSAVMRDGVEVRSDERVWLMMNIGSMSTAQVCARVCVWVGVMMMMMKKQREWQLTFTQPLNYSRSIFIS